MILSDARSKPPIGKTLRTLNAESYTLDTLYADKFCKVSWDNLETPLYPNQPVVLRSGKSSALALVNPEGDRLNLVDTELSFFKVSARNKEQHMIMNLLLDPKIRVVVVTGAAGTGKSLCIGAYALHKVLETQEWEKLLLSKPLEVTTRTKFWGTVPGDEDDKFAPFLRSYMMMFENMMGKSGVQYLQSAKDRGTLEFFPLELMRGVSIQNSIVWFDEVQNLNAHEMQTLGSRIDDVGNSKLIISGDLKQRDSEIQRTDTGLMQLVQSPAFLESPFTAHVHLTKIERGVVAQLFHDVFGSDG